MTTETTTTTLDLAGLDINTLTSNQQTVLGILSQQGFSRMSIQQSEVHGVASITGYSFDGMSINKVIEVDAAGYCVVHGFTQLDDLSAEWGIVGQAPMDEVLAPFI